MGRFQTKAPGTYRKKYPGRFVVAAVFVAPNHDMLFEMAVDKDLFEKLYEIYVEEIRKKAKVKTTMSSAELNGKAEK